jgi:hypothetical protein
VLARTLRSRGTDATTITINGFRCLPCWNLNDIGIETYPLTRRLHTHSPGDNRAQWGTMDTVHFSGFCP